MPFPLCLSMTQGQCVFLQRNNCSVAIGYHLISIWNQTNGRRKVDPAHSLTWQLKSSTRMNDFINETMWKKSIECKKNLWRVKNILVYMYADSIIITMKGNFQIDTRVIVHGQHFILANWEHVYMKNRYHQVNRCWSHALASCINIRSVIWRMN